MSLPLEQNSWRSTHGKQPTWQRTNSLTGTTKNQALRRLIPLLLPSAGSLHAAGYITSIGRFNPSTFASLISTRDNPLQ
jgi:hypothetical protein